MEIINAHAHIYPERIAQKATAAIGDFYSLNMELSCGTVSKLLIDGKKAGITKHVVHSVATNPHQVRSINDFLKSEIDIHAELIGFIALHSDLSREDINSEIEWGRNNGFLGIKLHPDFQRFYIDSVEAREIYSAAQGKLPILVHIGDDRYDFSHPERLIKMAREYSDTVFIAAHFGGYRCWDNLERYKDLKNVYFDTSSSLAFISVDKAKETIDTLGADRFFFGTDFPMWRATGELDRFYKIPLSESERRMILADNFKRVFKIN